MTEGEKDMKLFWKILLVCIVLVAIFYAVVLVTAWI